jgi:putative ABC transport system permease protein
MSFLSAIRVALSALLVNKGRSMLTSLGIVIGISAVIAMVSAGSGARSKLDERLDSVGKNLILIRPGARTQQGIVTDSVPLTSEDAAAIRKQLKPLLVGVAESRMTQRMVTTRYGNHGTVLVGSTPDLEKIRNWKMAAGRFYNDEDVKRWAPVCLIGKTVTEKLFPGKPNPVGQTITVGLVRLRVVGLLASKGRSPTGADQDDQIFLPITTLEHHLGSEGRVAGEGRIALILASTHSENMVDQAKNDIKRILRERHHIKPGAQEDFDVSSVAEMAELAVILTNTMQLLIAIIASISLVVGGIGIMNIMLVSVTERTREIGIRMAIGATPADVLIQFLIEAVVLALAGGIIGISAGIGGAFGLAELASWPVKIQGEVILLAFGVAAGVGIFFGYYPALKASRLDPIDALRYE